MRRRDVIFGGAVLVAAPLAAPHVVRAQAKPFEGVVIRCNGYGGDYEKVLTQSVAAPIERKLGIKLQFNAGSVQADVARLIATKDDPPFDLFMGDSPQIAQLVSTGVLEKTTVADLPALSRVKPEYREFGDFGVPYSVANVVPVFNSQRVKPGFTGFADIARPDMKDRLIMSAGPLGSTGLVILALAQANGGGIENVDPAFEILQKAKPNIVSLYSTMVTPVQQLESEEAWGGVFWDGRAYALRKAGKPIETVVAKEGIYSVVSYMALVSRSKQRAAALAVLDQLLSDEGISGLPNFFRYSPTTDVKLPEDVAKDILINSPERLALKRKIDWVRLGELRAGWVDRFNRVMG